MSRPRPRRRAATAVLAATLALAAACTGTSEQGGPTTSAPAAPSTSAPPTSAPDSCIPIETCTLAEAGALSDVLVGTAGKFSTPERIGLQQREFSAITNENELLWSVVHPEPDDWAYEGGDRVVEFADEHDMEMTLTHFLWDPPALRQVLPDWVRAINDPEALRAVLRDHLSTLHDRYGERVDRLNVVNEPLTNAGELEPANHFREVLGEDYIAEAFTMADEIWPEAMLVLNENLVEYVPAKADALVALAEDLVERGVPIDGVGLQVHLFAGEPDWAVLDDLLVRLDALGLDVAVTELDFPLRKPEQTLEVQADTMAHVVRSCLAVAGCSSITFWGFDDGDTWLDSFLEPGTRPLLFDAELQPKPAYDAVREALAAGRPSP